MIKFVVILAIVCQCIWSAKSDESSLVHFRTLDEQVKHNELQNRAWRSIAKPSPREVQWTDSIGSNVLADEAHDEQTALTTTDTRAAKIDFMALMVTLITNIAWGALNYFTQNYIGIFYNVVNIVEALLLFFFGS